MTGRGWHVRGDQTTDRLNDVLQRAAIVLVVLKQLSFDVRSFRFVPMLPPNYGLQSCRAFVGPFKPKESPDIFKAIRIDREVDVRMYDRQHVRCSLENRIDLRVEGLRQPCLHPFQCGCFISAEMEDSPISQVADHFNKLEEYVRLL